METAYWAVQEWLDGNTGKYLATIFTSYCKRDCLIWLGGNPGDGRFVRAVPATSERVQE